MTSPLNNSTRIIISTLIAAIRMPPPDLSRLIFVWYREQIFFIFLLEAIIFVENQNRILESRREINFEKLIKKHYVIVLLFYLLITNDKKERNVRKLASLNFVKIISLVSLQCQNLSKNIGGRKLSLE